MTALEELMELSREPYNPLVKDWKEKGGKVIGFVCSYVPEEILHAAGLLPFRITPTGCTTTLEADAYFSRINCTFCRACLQMALEGKFGFLDGLVGINPCDHIRRLWDLWRLKAGLPFMKILSLPHRVHEGAVEWYKGEIQIFKGEVEKAFDTQINEDSLGKSIEIFNTSREWIRKLYDLRTKENPPLSGNEVTRIIVALLHIPREEGNKLLERLLNELENRKGISDYRARLMVAGGACDDPEFIEVIEKAGGLVVTDSLCFGSRYFFERVKTDDDLLRSLSMAYLNRPFCAGMAGGERNRLNFNLEMAQRFSVNGIVFQKIRWCDLWGGEAFYLGEKLKELGIPYLSLEREYWLSGQEQMKTRVQAFLEMIGK
jgi:bcr-type benzoyl-CoA reductase subunit C